ncbi:hypothetical protein T01_11803 [Trichinella spiralis]|uniref:Uncharacterized protein n=1 Tax=Trichinella spiralis TaxID=6334 RepID=A0A0V1ARD0_TRISP|nr:hypothetical protein T01_11803 [Trichinella spiralis]
MRNVQFSDRFLFKAAFKTCSERTPMTNGVQHCVGFNVGMLGYCRRCHDLVVHIGNIRQNWSASKVLNPISAVLTHTEDTSLPQLCPSLSHYIIHIPK